MKKLILFSIMILGLQQAQAQQKEVHTLVSGRTRVGAYVSFENQIQDFNGAGAGMYTGGRIGLIFNRYLFIGVGGYGLSSGLSFRDLVDDSESYRLETGYGGLSIEPILFPRQPIHLSFPLFAGIGGAQLNRAFRSGNGFVDDDLFGMYQGGANIELNVTKWIRLSGGVYYTQTEDFVLRGTRNDLLEGLSYGMSLKLGRF